MNTQLHSQKVSPFKPMGGGFKQNLNYEVSAERIEKEAALQQDKLKSQNIFGGYRRSRHVSNGTLALSDHLSDAQVGFNIA